jgi:hypothetical protein
MPASTSPVRPEFGPPLVELLHGGLGLPRRVVVAGAAAVVALGAGLVVFVLAHDSTRNVVHRSAPVFNFSYQPGALRAVAPDAGGLYRLEARRGGAFLESFAVRELRMAPYAGSPTGQLPLYATRHLQDLRRRFPAFAGPLDEGKITINGIAGYTTGFQARVDGRFAYGRDVLLLPPTTGARTGIVVTMLQTPEAGATSADVVGDGGALKIALLTLNFGTARAKGY